MTRKKSKYELQESARAKNLIKNSNIFNGDAGGKLFPTDNGVFPKPDYLLQSRNNLINSIVHSVIDYFVENKISFWKTGIAGVDEMNMPTGHTLSSQISCLNHLFPLRYDKEAVLQIAKSICVDFQDVIEITTDAYSPAYIAFEVVSDTDHLKEGNIPTRGEYYTSVDALIYALHTSGNKYLIPIEWKYTEKYFKNENEIEDKEKYWFVDGKYFKDYSIEDKKHTKFEKEGKGKERLRRYADLIKNSKQLNALPEYKNSIYFFEPFYQLMRQTLWAEQMIEHKDSETLKADDFIHVHVIPQENSDLLNKIYPKSGKEMKETWLDCLHNQDKYKIISPNELLKNIDKEKYKELLNYIQTRYW
jgi:hypothetical protein